MSEHNHRQVDMPNCCCNCVHLGDDSACPIKMYASDWICDAYQPQIGRLQKELERNDKLKEMENMK